MEINNKKILPSVTTFDIDWKELIKEVNKFNLKEIGLFLTCSKKPARKEIYSLLENSSVEKIPFVHLRSDMDVDEMKYLIDTFSTQKFNIHPKADFPMLHDISKYKEMVYVENSPNRKTPLKEEELAQWAGICVDLCHLAEAEYTDPQFFRRVMKTIKNHTVGCNHLSPFPLKNLQRVKNHEKPLMDEWHHLEGFSQLNYLRNFPDYVFSDLIALEMKNSIKEQLGAIDYIKVLLTNNGEK